LGIDGKIAKRNSPTVFNSRYNAFQFWDGRAKDLHTQAMAPMNNPDEMNSDIAKSIDWLKEDDYYLKSFTKLYKDGITFLNITHAIAEFEKALTTPNSKFDKFLRGDEKALNTNEKKGYQIFLEHGCVSCHNGINIGGNIMQKIGAIEAYDTSDLGLYNSTKNIEDKYYFKVPSLRNVELTAPYFHDGRVSTLKDAITIMMRNQIGFLLTVEDIDNVELFLKTLTGENPSILNKKHK